MSETHARSRTARRLLSTRRLVTRIALACVVGFCGSISAQNGTVVFTTPICGNGSQSAGADLAFDTPTNTVWVLDQATGEICQYPLAAIPPGLIFTVSVNHPFGPQGGIGAGFLPLCTGFTYDPTAQNFFILALTTTGYMIATIDSSEVAVAPLVAPSLLANSSLSGLARDSVTGNIWTRDTENHVALELNPTTGAIDSEVNLPGEAFSSGVGLAFTNASGVRALEFTRGTVLTGQPTKLVRIDAVTGQELCVDVDLRQVPDPVLGVVRSPTGTSIFATTATDLYQIDATQGPLTAPRQLECFQHGERLRHSLLAELR